MCKRCEADIESAAAAMFDGGWRSTDRDEWIAEYCDPANDDLTNLEDWERYEFYFKKWEAKANETAL